MRNLVFLLLIVISTSCGAQKEIETVAKEPITLGGSSNNFDNVASWKYQIEKLDTSNEYMITAKIKLDKGWHIFDFNPGGDGLLIAPDFIFKDKGVEIIKKTALGTLITSKFTGVDEDVRYYENEVSFKLRVRSMSKDFKGSVYYQLCDHEKCLAPTERPFVLTIK